MKRQPYKIKDTDITAKMLTLTYNQMGMILGCSGSHVRNYCVKHGLRKTDTRSIAGRRRAGIIDPIEFATKYEDDVVTVKEYRCPVCNRRQIVVYENERIVWGFYNEEEQRCLEC